MSETTNTLEIIDEHSLDRHWMQIALFEARKAHVRGDWPTGAVLVKDGKLLSRGQNRQNSLGDVTLHAEVEALRGAFVEHGPDATRGATLYSTMEPCPMCAGALKLGGIRCLVLALRHARLRRTDLGDFSMEHFCRMTGFELELRDGVLEEDALALRLSWGRDAVQQD